MTSSALTGLARWMVMVLAGCSAADAACAAGGLEWSGMTNSRSEGTAFTQNY
jgi:hypothetical protein